MKHVNAKVLVRKSISDKNLEKIRENKTV